MAKILIIDDDQDIVDNLSLVLTANGHQVESRSNTDDLLQEVTRADPDLIILDVIFPEDPQAGFKAARLLSKNPRLGRIPILLLSAVNQRSNLAFSLSDSDISDDFMPVGAFVDKPVRPDDLLAKVDDLLHPGG